ncbi:MAG TPA: hypothetical protein VFS97_10120 [Nitrososphaeraceae archaeon]|nr:hypothetical protein [Nitrososphaeraceae archaeon]
MKKISRCNICGEFFDSKRALKDHKDRNHRVTNSRMVGVRKNQNLHTT